MSVPRSATIVAEVALVHRVDRLEPEAGREDAVERGRRAAAQHVAEDRDARLEAGAALDLLLRAACRSRRGARGRTRRCRPTGASSCPRPAPRPRRRRRSRTPRPARGGGARRAHTSSMSNGSSGTRMMSAPPARPQYVAIQPAWRPITSTTITRSWLSAVVCSRSIASVAICTAVSKPNVKSVAERSLSIVFGTPTTCTPSLAELGCRPRACPRRRSR